LPAAIHALIVGVSDYMYLPGGSGSPSSRSQTLGLAQLTASARSAATVRDWLNAVQPRLPLPLGSCRVLLSPSAGERGIEEGADAATQEHVRAAAIDWREDCSSHRDNIALFFFAGHGIRRTQDDATLLCADFAEDGGSLLYRAIDVQNLFSGMAPSSDHPEMARTQLWFIDACQAAPSAFDRFETSYASAVWDTPLAGFDDRCAPKFWAAVPGTSAYSVPGEHTIFSRALLACLDGAAGVRGRGVGEWEVTVGSLTQTLDEVVADVGRSAGANQIAGTYGALSRLSTPIVRLPGAPTVPVSFELRPSERALDVSLAVREAVAGTRKQIPEPLAPNPWMDAWPAGTYVLDAQPPTCGIPAQELPVMPPRYEWLGEVER
jgi:hypothetical protein